MSRERTHLERDHPAAALGGPTGPHVTVSAAESVPSANADNRPAATGLSMAEAERLLDWLEANGHRNVRLTSEPGGTFTVSWPTA